MMFEHLNINQGYGISVKGVILFYTISKPMYF
jgi:hypothetical protein